MEDAPFLVAVALLPIFLGLCAAVLVRRWRSAAPGTRRWIGLRTGLALPIAVAVLAAAAAGFAGCEAYFRLVFDGTNTFRLGRAAARWAERHVETNTLGVRDDLDYASTVAAGKRRISLLGGSFTTGHGVDDAALRFANLIRRAQPDWEVHVLALPGVDTRQHLRMIERVSSTHYVLDIVVLVYNLDDVLAVENERAGVRGLLYEGHLDEGWLLAKSYALNTLHYARRSRTSVASRTRMDVIQAAYEGPEWAEQRALLVELEEAVTSRGGRFGAVTFPFLHATAEDGYAFTSAHDAVAAHFAERGVLHLDLLPAYRDEDPAGLIVSEADIHPSERAHAIAAVALEPFLGELIRASEPR